MSPARKRNLIRAPFVLLIRVPIMLPFWLLYFIGEIAEKAGNWLSHRLPGFESEPRT
jgi:hypothetical protein